MHSHLKFSSPFVVVVVVFPHGLIMVVCPFGRPNGVCGLECDTFELYIETYLAL